VQGKPEDFIGANPGSVDTFQQKGLVEAQHLVIVCLIDKHIHYSSETLMKSLTMHYHVTLGERENQERMKPSTAALHLNATGIKVMLCISNGQEYPFRPLTHTYLPKLFTSSIAAIP